MSADVLRRRDVSSDVSEKFTALFAAGHSPSSALESHKCDLHMEDAAGYSVKAADRYYCPDLQWCYRLYYKLFRAEYGTQSGPAMIDALKQRLETWNAVQDGTVTYDTVSGEHVVAICTPLMKRVHEKVLQSSELVFMDSSGCMDTSNYRVFMLMTNCAAGGLPLGMFISTSESESALVAGLQLLKSLLPSDCFHGRGSRGPMFFMTDDCAAERNALAMVYPDSVALLCQFHVLWAAWRWLWNSNNGIQPSHRGHLYNLVKRAVFARTSHALAEALTALHHDDIAASSEKFGGYCDKLLQKSELWAACYREDVALRAHNTNNTVESSIRILKDRIFSRLKAFNLVQLTDFFVTRLESYYERRLTNIANNRLDDLRQSRYFPRDNTIALCNVWMVAADVVSVPSATLPDVSYVVNTAIWVCSCPIGVRGAPCKHQWAAATKYSIACFNFLPVESPALRKLFHYLATGTDDMPNEWFSGLRNRSDCDIGEVTDVEPVMDDSQQSEQLITSSVDDVECSADEVVEVVTQLGRVTDSLTRKLQREPGTYMDGVKAFIANFDKIQTTSGLLSAMHCFGKYSGAATAMIAGRKRKAVAFATKRIGVQPTAVARRSMKCFGRRAAGAGRPSKLTRAAEHGYGKSCTRPAHAGIPPRKTAAPHSLQECVSRHVSLGK